MRRKHKHLTSGARHNVKKRKQRRGESGSAFQRGKPPRIYLEEKAEGD